MEKIEILFSNMFDNERVTNSRLATYTLDHLMKVEANNPGGVFAAIITATQTAMNNFGEAIGQEGGNIGDRKGETIVKEQAKRAFINFISQKEGLIKATFGVQSLPYMQFFPDGLNAFHHTTDTGFIHLVNNIVDRATQYETELGTPFKTQAETLADAYIAAEAAQTTEKGEVSGSKELVGDRRAELTAQLTINALTIALQFPMQADKVPVYFDTSLLFAPKRKRIYKGTPEANALVKVTDLAEFEPGKLVKMKNKGATSLRFQMHLLGSPVGNSFTLGPNGSLTKREDEFFSNADSLYVTNLGDTLGQYIVELVA